jgi:hypothetical protein
MNWFSILVGTLTAMLPTLKKVTETTANLLDDIGYRIAELCLTDAELLAEIKAWLEGKVADVDGRLMAAVGTDDLVFALQADSGFMSIVHQVAGRLDPERHRGAAQRRTLPSPASSRARSLTGRAAGLACRVLFLSHAA